MNAPVRTPLHEEMAVALAVAEQLRLAGIDETDPDYAELLAGETDVQDRLKRILRVARMTENQSKALGEMLTEMRDRKARLDAKADRLRGIVLRYMGELGLKRLEAPDFTATVATGRGKVVITADHSIPARFWVTSRNLDRISLAAALKEGAVPGAELSSGEPSLTVRVR